MSDLKIRKRERRGRPREAFGDYAAWTEYQVVEGRKVLLRFDTREQAERFIEMRNAQPASDNGPTIHASEGC